MLDNLFIEFEPFDQEIAKKLVSIGTPHQQLMLFLIERLVARAGLSQHDVKRLDLLYRQLASLPFDAIYSNYLSHPIRLAAAYADLLEHVNYDDVALALCHNIRETGYGWSRAIEAEFLSAEISQCVDILATDRSHEKDSAYLTTFYNKIEHSPRALMALKALDKLDNTLWWVRFDVADYEVRVVLDYVCPRIALNYPQLESYLRKLVHYTRRNEVKTRFAAETNLLGQ